MKCEKCNVEIPQDSKFCGQCGEKVEIPPKPISFGDTIAMSSRIWFMLGYMKGQKDNKEFEKILKKNHKEMYKWYNDVWDFWKNFAIENDEELKKLVSKLKNDTL
ncbi:MAG: zinc ribbon domain-containing protein [Candidatus Pacearchaeota archaeon]